ncbi:hypothetical protein ACFFX0_22925 [Citricoccus parietis]|uniref:Uncharacterized protein n=1 Tax=Citricoccus parietis TaxID=592307 RepID=A0ABV5G4N5_9MICC
MTGARHDVQRSTVRSPDRPHRIVRTETRSLARPIRPLQGNETPIQAAPRRDRQGPTVA